MILRRQGQTSLPIASNRPDRSSAMDTEPLVLNSSGHAIMRATSFCAVLVSITVASLLTGSDRAYAQLIEPSTDSGWTFEPGSGRWEKGYEEFRRDDMTEKQRERGDRPSSSGSTNPDGSRKTELERGCVGVTNALAGFPVEDLNASDCYLDEADALARAATKVCPDGQKPQVYAVRYWDSKKDTRTVGADGRYPVDMDELYRARPGYVNYDFGYRQSDGSYVHANHATPGMKVKISPSKDEFDNGYAGFNTVLYCVRCGEDDSVAHDGDNHENPAGQEDQDNHEHQDGGEDHEDSE